MNDNSEPLQAGELTSTAETDGRAAVAILLVTVVLIVVVVTQLI